MFRQFASAIGAVTLVLAGAFAYLNDTNPALADFEGTPSSPQPLNDPRWAVDVDSRDPSTWDLLDPMNAQHGPDCSAPPATHVHPRTYESAVFICNNHVMTAIRG